MSDINKASARDKRTFSKMSFTTKESLLEDIDKMANDICIYARYTQRHNEPYKIREFLRIFYKDVERLILPSKLEYGWDYAYVIDEFGIELKLVHSSEITIDYSNNKAPKICKIHDQIYSLHKTNAQLLSVEDFARLNNVEPITVRQWIRRGKLHGIIKKGNQWYISELCEISKRGTIQAEYQWDAPLKDLPSEYLFLNSYSSISFIKTDGRNHYDIYLKGSEHTTKSISSSEKERLEFFLLSHSGVKYVSCCSEVRWGREEGDENVI